MTVNIFVRGGNHHPTPWSLTGTLLRVKVVPPTFLHHNERNGCRNDYIEALDRIRLRFMRPGTIR